MLLNKKLFKILSVLVAVIIAFCSFTVSASADTYENFDLDFFFSVLIYDSEGNIIDESAVPLEDIKFNSIKKFYYFDVPAPEGFKFFEPGTAVGFSFSSSLPSEFYVFSFSSGVSVDFSFSSSFSFSDGFTVGFTGISSTGSPVDSFAILNSDRELRTLSIAFAPAIIEDSSDGPKFLGPKLQPGMFDFYSNINTFFKQSVSWFSSIFSKVVLQPSLTVLVLGFIAVGFVFGLLHRLIRSH